MVLARIWHMVRGERRRPTSAQTFRRAQRLRDEGRFEDAAALVDSGLVLEPGSVVGHLLAGSLHVILRESGQARTSFERALALEPDFPEARALLEVVKGLPASDAAKRSAPPNSAIRADRLRLPAESREALLARADATLVFAQPRGPRTEAVVARAAKLSRVAAAMLARAGLGPLRHAVIEGAAETTYLRADDAALLTLAFDRDVKAATAIAHLERVWANCRSELA